MIPLISLWGLDFASLLGGGTILIEEVFNINGVGKYVGDSIGRLDVPADPRHHDLRRVRRRRALGDRRHPLRRARSPDQALLMSGLRRLLRSRIVRPIRQLHSLLEVVGLTVSFRTEQGVVHAVQDASFTVARGEVVAVVGESGSGKSVTGLTLMGLTRSPNATIGGSALLSGRELIGASEATLRAVRGAEIAMIFQDPMSSLNPVTPGRRADRRADPRPSTTSPTRPHSTVPSS